MNKTILYQLVCEIFKVELKSLLTLDTDFDIYIKEAEFRNIIQENFPYDYGYSSILDKLEEADLINETERQQITKVSNLYISILKKHTTCTPDIIEDELLNRLPLIIAIIKSLKGIK